MADLYSRRESWLDYLPGNVQQSINTSPILNALGRAFNRPAPDLTRGIERDQYGNVSDWNWLLEQARGGPPKLNPLAAEMLDKGGMLANFLGPGYKGNMRPIDLVNKWQTAPIQQVVAASDVPLGRLLDWSDGLPILPWNKNPEAFAGSIVRAPDGVPFNQWHIVDGRLIYHPKYMDQRIREGMIRDINSLLEPRYDHYFRSTNNKREIDLIKSGDIRPSRNHAEGFMEKGLSVADGPHYAGTAGYKYAYPIKGKAIGTGSDGEPVLDVRSLTPLWQAPRPVSDVLNKDARLAIQLQKQLEMDRLKTLGLPINNPLLELNGK